MKWVETKTFPSGIKLKKGLPHSKLVKYSEATFIDKFLALWLSRKGKYGKWEALSTEAGDKGRAKAFKAIFKKQYEGLRGGPSYRYTYYALEAILKVVLMAIMACTARYPAMQVQITTAYSTLMTVIVVVAQPYNVCVCVCAVA